MFSILTLFLDKYDVRHSLRIMYLLDETDLLKSIHFFCNNLVMVSGGASPLLPHWSRSRADVEPVRHDLGVNSEHVVMGLGEDVFVLGQQG